MVLSVDVEDGGVREWHTTPDGGATSTLHAGYTPSLYLRPAHGQLDPIRQRLAVDPAVADTAVESMYPSLAADERATVLRIDVERMADVTPLARTLKHDYERELATPGAYRLFNVDLAPQFRYVTDRGLDPAPAREPTTLSLALPTDALAAGDITALAIDGEPAGSDPADVLQTVHGRVARADPDVLIVSSGDLVPLLFERAARQDRSFALGRRPGYTQLAGENTFESYGRVGHSPARYNVPGRVLLDRSNSFLWGQSDLAGLLDLVERSHKPLQEVAWASIGNVLTAIQIHEARNRDVLIPWNKWEPEAFKDVHTLHAADRGGFTFQPDVGLHEDVVEVDFASLYPRIICEYNISPETILCDCHPDRETVPELAYNVCPEPGFLPGVLAPILADRAAFKETLAGIDDGSVASVADAEALLADTNTADLPIDVADVADLADTLRARSGALKWILVSCFGYQGYRNSKFGRIECHEAINAVARDVLLTAKEHAESRGWRVVHGIVDSLWLAPAADDHADVTRVTDAVSDAIGIDLEVEARYDWVGFVPKRETDGGALTRYFGKFADDDRYKVRGIEARQRSTPPFVESVQRELLATLDDERAPEPVVERLRSAIGDLQAGRVAPADLVITQRVSKHRHEYAQATRAVAALERAALHDVERQPGQDVHYVVVDDDADGRERVRLAFESVETYDVAFYTDLLVRACESVVSALGWDRADVRRYLTGEDHYELSAFG